MPEITIYIMLRNIQFNWDASIVVNIVWYTEFPIVKWEIDIPITFSCCYECSDKRDRNLLSTSNFSICNSYKLINASIELNYPGIPYNLIKQYSEDMSDNKMCHTILRDLVVHHMYRFDIDHTTRSQITNLNLGLSMETQRYIQSSSQIKR